MCNQLSCENCGHDALIGLVQGLFKTFGRYIIDTPDTNLLEMGISLLAKYGADYLLPRKPMPEWIVWLAATMFNKSMTRKVVSLVVDLPWKGDNSKSIRDLGIAYRPIKESIEDMFQQMIDHGRVKKNRTTPRPAATGTPCPGAEPFRGERK